MGKHVTFDYSLADKFIREDEVELMMASVHAARETLESKSGAGNDFLGWIDLPEDYDKAEFERIQAAAKKIQSDSDVLVVIGIGGSYLGARAAIEFLRHCFYNSVDKSVRKTPEIYYAGNNISGTYLAQLIETIGDRAFSVNVISKSGTTTEPAIAFRVMKEILENKYGKDIKIDDLDKLYDKFDVCDFTVEERFRLIRDFVACMTDKFALDHYQKISGQRI